MNDALLRRDVERVCIETAKCFLPKATKGNGGRKLEGTERVISDAREFYEEHYLGSTNTYVLEFLSRRGEEMAESDDRLQRLGAIELMVFLATAGGRATLVVARPLSKKALSRPTSTDDEGAVCKVFDTDEAGLEAGLAAELQHGAGADPLRVEHFVTMLYKAGQESRLWRVGHHLTRYPDHARRLHGLAGHGCGGAKSGASSARRLALLHAGVRTLSHGPEHIRSSAEYKPIVIQCMLKAEYLFDDLGVIDRQTRLYLACLYRCPTKAQAQTRRTCERAFDDEIGYKTLTLSESTVPSTE